MFTIMSVRELSKKDDCVTLCLSQRVLRISVSNVIYLLIAVCSISFLLTIQLCIFLIWQSKYKMQNLSLLQWISFSDQTEKSISSVYKFCLMNETQSVIWVSDCSKEMSVRNHLHTLKLKFLNMWTVSELTVISKWVSSAITLFYLMF